MIRASTLRHLGLVLLVACWRGRSCSARLPAADTGRASRPGGWHRTAGSSAVLVQRPLVAWVGRHVMLRATISG
jgi:hypothetical protein